MPNMITIAGGIVAGVISLGSVATGAWYLDEKYALKIELKEKVETAEQTLNKSIELAGLSLEQITIGQSKLVQEQNRINRLNYLYNQRYSTQDRIYYIRQEKEIILYYGSPTRDDATQRHWGKLIQEETYLLNKLERLDREINALENQ